MVVTKSKYTTVSYVYRPVAMIIFLHFCIEINNKSKFVIYKTFFEHLFTIVSADRVFYICRTNVFQFELNYMNL